MRKRRRTLQAGPQLKGLVLDLRNDPGGLLDGAVAISAAFLPAKQLVVSDQRPHRRRASRSSSPRPSTTCAAARATCCSDLPAAVKNVPMVVLVNGGSASASRDRRRRAAGPQARHHHGHADLRQGLGADHAAAAATTPRIKLTTARYYTPSGRSIQAKGIVPDIIVEEPGASAASRLREADLERHLENDREAEAEKKKGPRVTPAVPAGELPKPIEFGSKDDFQLAQALNYLQGKPVMGQPSKAVAENKSGS